ncbi:MAG: NfeD family protein [Acidilobaceae archaeon]
MDKIEVLIGLIDELLIALALVGVLSVIAYHLNIIGLGEAIVLTIILAAILAFIAYKVLEVHRQKVRVGIEAYIGKKAKVVEVRGSKILIMVEGELWQAESEDKLEQGETVIIVGFINGKFKVKLLKA